MKSKIFMHLGPKLSVPVDLTPLHFRKGLSGLLDLCLKLSTVAVFIFLAGILAFDILNPAAGVATIYVTYITVIIGLGLQLAKKLLGKGDFLPQVNFDLPLLTFTTVIACSLFLVTAILKQNINIWGGPDLRAISGVIIIAYWFVFYLLSANIRDRQTLRRSLTALWSAPLIALFFWLITFRDFSAVQSTVIGLLAPGTLWLLLTQNRNHWLHLLNLIICVTLLVVSGNRYVIFVVFLMALLSFLFLVIINRNKLLSLFQGLKADRNSKFKFWEYLNRNAVIIYLLISLLAVFGGMVWIASTLTPAFFDTLVQGAKLIKFQNLGSLLLGNGTSAINAPLLLQFANSFGVIPFLFLLAVSGLLIRTAFRVYKKTGSSMSRGILLWIATTLGAFCLYLLFSSQSVELIILYGVVLVTFSGIITTLLTTPKLKPLNLEVQDFAAVKKPNLHVLLKIIQIVSVIVLFFAAIYLLSSLNYISIFITASLIKL